MPVEPTAGPTVGRDHELEQLSASLDGLAAGAPGFIVVEGEPGIGKTHLLTALRRGAEERGCLVLAGSATEFERDLPFSVWVDALDAYVASQELDLDARWGSEQVDELAKVIPSVRRGGPTAGGTVADERYRAHRAVRALLELLSETLPLVVVLDDLHWSDEASIELLAGLLRREPDGAVLLAVGLRPGQAPAPLSAALAVPSRSLVERALPEEAVRHVAPRFSGWEETTKDLRSHPGAIDPKTLLRERYGSTINVSTLSKIVSIAKEHGLEPARQLKAAIARVTSLSMVGSTNGVRSAGTSFNDRAAGHRARPSNTALV